MKYSVIFVLFLVSWCEANPTINIVCQVARSTKSIENYCGEYRGAFPQKCSNGPLQIEPSELIQLKMGGCNRYTVIDWVKNCTNLRELDVSHSAYESLDLFDKSKFKRLQKFNASHNFLKNLGKLLKNAPELAELDLSYNNFTDSSATLFEGATKLTKLHLAHNYFPSAFYGLKNLSTIEYVDLRSNNLVEIPQFFNNENVKTVHLEENYINGINCYNIETIKNATLFFSWNQVVSFSGHPNCGGRKIDIIWNRKFEGINIDENKCVIHLGESKFENLEKFTAGSKTLASVTNILSAFDSSIQKIDLSGNSIGKLNATTMNTFYKLTHLSLSDTKLESFDFAIVKQEESKLIHLDISFNNLRRINNTPTLNHFHLNELNIAGNKLERSNTTAIIRHLTPSIVNLDLSGNFVGNINYTTFILLTEMERLNLSNTNLIIIDKMGNPFQPLGKLISLDISHNNLAKVNFSISRTLNQLRYFNAADCQIQNITDIIQHLGPSIYYLDLSGNFIGTVNAQTFEKLVNLQYLRLSKANIINFDVNAFQKQRNLLSLDISNNQLQAFDLGFLSEDLKWINLAGNDLTIINNFTDSRFQWLMAMDISNNQLDCAYLKHLIRQFKWSKLSGEHWMQKQDRDCRTTGQGIRDFLSSFANKFKIW